MARWVLLISILNLIAIFLLYLNSFIQNNNHYAISIDTYFMSSSIIIFLFSLFCCKRNIILLSMLALVMSVVMNVYNIGVSYEIWIEREQPELATK
ncbi:hypothetical protein EC844_111100 [Acinetobacter calcoaceticus]|uniref:Uncharacterized protein n=1 Tax=Acinetobacter calcoaceticus TaxID=471 RepID=A0A4R1XWA6_ACICA|nr:hypothetical protein EC844_111100 [Acinetobacter calcoaceticus]